MEEIDDDPAYEGVVTPLLLEVLDPTAGCRYLDLGAGEGRVMRRLAALGSVVVGIDVNEDLARTSSMTMIGRIPDIPIADRSVDGVYAVLVLEHLPEHTRFFAEAARVTRPGGVLAVVMNHPAWTAPEATPITDGDGELLWRPGQYFRAGPTRVTSRGRTITFHHRSLASLLSTAASCGWALEVLVERPHHEPDLMPAVPHLLASRWRLLP